MQMITPVLDREPICDINENSAVVNRMTQEAARESVSIVRLKCTTNGDVTISRVPIVHRSLRCCVTDEASISLEIKNDTTTLK
ncbi:MAG: hypothetical protein A2W23_00665 [Planctomycetes bacterium RBG_16_43_13]|nr:MAG: hypothetical protein A2W23_00665 [Planctomycetes bacterium RBG_16_43_13]